MLNPQWYKQHEGIGIPGQWELCQSLKCKRTSGREAQWRLKASFDLDVGRRAKWTTFISWQSNGKNDALSLLLDEVASCFFAIRDRDQADTALAS
jgi:hypothetical protein